jgi:excisionase family DNA binding protein
VRRIRDDATERLASVVDRLERAWQQPRSATEQSILADLQLLLRDLSTPQPAPVAGHDRLLTVREAAERLQVHESTIYEMVARRQITARRIGRSIRIPATAIAP